MIIKSVGKYNNYQQKYITKRLGAREDINMFSDTFSCSKPFVNL